MERWAIALSESALIRTLQYLELNTDGQRWDRADRSNRRLLGDHTPTDFVPTISEEEAISQTRRDEKLSHLTDGIIDLSRKTHKMLAKRARNGTTDPLAWDLVVDSNVLPQFQSLANNVLNEQDEP